MDIMDLTDYIKPDHVLFLQEKEKRRVIGRLADKAGQLGLIKDRAGFEAAVRHREDISSTGIGMGLAIPHGRCREITDFFIISAIAGQPVEWQAIDYAPVKAVFLIGIPENAGITDNNTARQYLEIVAELMLLVKTPRRRERLFSAASPEEVIDVLSNPNCP